MLGNATVLAHQGGWDEALMVIAPVGLFGGLVWIAYRRSAPPIPSEDRPTDDAVDARTRDLDGEGGGR